MKNKFCFANLRVSRRLSVPILISAVFACALMQSKVQAASGTWNTTTSGNWSTAGSWLSSIIANDNASTANFVFNITAATTVTLDTSRTINKIVFTDATTASHDWTLARSGTAVLTLAGTAPSISSTNRTATISAVLDGTTAWSKIGTNVLVLTGANTFSGALTVNDGTLRLGAAAALGNATTIIVENNAADNNTMELAGGFTYGTGKTLTLRNNATGATIPGARAQLSNQAGNNTWAGNIVLDGGTNQTLVSPSGVLTIAGNIGVSAAPPTSLFIRGVASGVLNGNLNLGTTGLLKTDTGSWTINSTGNTHGQVTVSNGSVVLNNNDALAPASVLVFGETNSTNTGTLTVNAGFTQTIGDITVAPTSTSVAGQRLTGPGSVDLGATSRAFTINDGIPAADDLTISAPVLGAGGFVKSGTGVLMVNSAVTGPVTVSAGILGGTPTFNGGLTVNDLTGLIVGGRLTAGTLAASTLTFGTGATSVAMNVGPGGDLVTVATNNGLTFNGTTTINVSRYGGNLPVGVYPLINFTGTPQGSGGFVLGPLPPYLTATIIPTASGGALDVTASDHLVWTGNTSANWDVTTVDNWKLASDNSPVVYQDAAPVTFGDTGLNPTVNVVAAVNPGWLTFSNSIAGPAWRTTGLAINGPGGITKSNTGTATLANAVGLTGPVLVQNGTLEVDHDTGSLTATPEVNVATGATLLLSRDNGDFTFNRNLTGSGTVVIDPVTSTLTPASRAVTLSGTNTGFTGLLKLTPSGTVATNGSFRTVAGTNQNNLGSATVDVDLGGQLWFSSPINNNIILSGSGYSEPAGNAPATSAVDLAGNPLTVPSFTYGGIGAIRMENASVVTGSVTLDGDAKIMAYNATGRITGPITNTSSSDTLVVGGGGAGSTLITSGDITGLERIWVNGGGTAGVNVLQLGDNGTTGELAANVDIILYNDAAGAGFAVNRSDGFTLGAGQNLIAAHNGTATNLSKSSLTVNTPTPGTGFTMGANTIDLSDGINGGTVFVAGRAGGGNGVANSLLNIGAGSVLDAGSLFLGEGANLTATVDQTGGTVTLINQLRVGHYPANGFYNLSAGSVAFTGANPLANPSGGGEQNGGIYLGIDGTGVLNQTGGTVSTNFVVLDNRIATAGTDQYNLSGGTLNLTGTWGIIRRNATAEFNFSGGTIRNAGSGLIAAIDSPLVVSNATPVLDTNGATNSFNLIQGLAGTAGTLTAQGGGTVFLNGASTFTGTLAVTGGTTLSGTGSFPGTATVTNVSPGASTAVGTFGTLTLGDPGAGTTTTTVGGTVAFDLNAADKVAGNDLVVVNDDLNLAAGKILPRFYGGAPTAGTYRLFNFTGALAGTPAFDPSFVAADLRMTFTLDTSVAQQVNLILAGATGDIVWAGDGLTNIWDVNSSASWVGPTNFFQLDRVTFDEAGSATPNVALTGTLLPSTVTVNSTSKNYTFAGTGLIGGGATLTKQGASQLTVLTNNTNTGATDIQGGIVQVGNGGTNGWLGSGGITSVGEVQFNRSDEVNLTSVLAGSGSLIQEGAGTLTLSGTNTLSGAIQVTGGGVLKAANVAAFGTSSGISVASGSQVNLNGTSFGNTRSYSYTIAGNGADGRGALINETANIAANAGVTNLTLTGNASIGAYGGTGDGNRFDFGFNGTVNGTVTGGGFTLTKLGDAMVNVRGAATDISYVVSAGTLRAETNSAALGSTLVTVNTGARLDSWGALTFAVPLVFAADSQLTSSNGVGTWTEAVTLNGATTIGGAGAGITLSGVVSGATGSIIKTDAATTLILSNNANSYGGGTTILGGTVQADANGALSTGAVVLSNTAVAGRLAVNGGVTIANNVTLGAGPLLAGVVGRGLIERAGTGQATLSGTVTVNSGASAGGTLFGSNVVGNELIFTGPIILNTGINLRDGRAIFSGGGTGNGNLFNVTGTMILGANDGLPSNVSLLLGASAAATFDLAGFNQTLVGLTKGGSAGTVTNTGATPSVLTLDIATAPNTYAGIITGDVALVKNGAAELILTGAGSTFTGNVDINAGRVTVNAGHNDINPNSALGNPVLGTRSVNVKAGTTLAFAGNDNLGNAASVPAMSIIVGPGAVLTNSGFNTLGPVTLNGATMSSTGGANPTFQSYRLFGTITAGGTAPSVITSSGLYSGYHLHSSTTFDVADVTANAAADLTVSAVLLNQSGTQGGAAGNLVKAGAGTLVLSGVNAYTGNTTIDAGTLQLADDARLSFSLGAASGTNNTLTGAGTAVLDGDFAVNTTAADALSAGTWQLENVTSLTGPYGSTFQVVNTDGTPWANTGDVWTKTGTGGRTWTFDEATGTLTLTLAPFDAWAAQIPNANDRDRSDDADGDGFTNELEFLFGTSPIVNNGVLVSSERSGNNLILQWLQRETGASYLLKESTTLVTASWATSPIVPVLGDQTGVAADYDRYTATLPIDTDRKFFRVEGTEN